MELFDAIAKRATYRGEYTLDKVPKEDLDKILYAALNAPSGKNEQTTSFVVVNDPEILKALAGILPRPVLNTAPCVIALVADTTPCYHDISFYKEDYSAAAMSIYLAATSLGYATCWLDGVLRLNDVDKKVSKLLNIPEDKTTCVLLPIGKPAQEVKIKEKKNASERVCYNKYSL